MFLIKIRAFLKHHEYQQPHVPSHNSVMQKESQFQGMLQNLVINTNYTPTLEN